MVSRVRRFLEVLGELRGGRTRTAPFRFQGSLVREDLQEIERRLAIVREVFGGEVAMASPYVEEARRWFDGGGEQTEDSRRFTPGLESPGLESPGLGSSGRGDAGRCRDRDVWGTA